MCVHVLCYYIAVSTSIVSAYVYMLMYCISVTVTSQPVNATTCTGEAATFECLAEGNFSTIASQNSIVWKRFITQSGDYKSLMPQSKYSSFVSFNNRFASLTGTLIIKNVTTDDEGWYVLKVGSDMMSNRAYLNVVTAAGTV